METFTGPIHWDTSALWLSPLGGWISSADSWAGAIVGNKRKREALNSTMRRGKLMAIRPSPSECCATLAMIFFGRFRTSAKRADAVSWTLLSTVGLKTDTRQLKKLK